MVDEAIYAGTISGLSPPCRHGGRKVLARKKGRIKFLDEMAMEQTNAIVDHFNPRDNIETSSPDEVDAKAKLRSTKGTRGCL